MSLYIKKILKYVLYLFIVIYIIGSAFMLIINERYIDTQGESLSYANEKIEKLEKDYEESDYGKLETDYFNALEQLQISNSELNHIRMKNEGMQYQELEENKSDTEEK